jgi:hypothetical protein
LGIAVRYEHIPLDVRTSTCLILEDIITLWIQENVGSVADATDAELINFRNELRARLQRRDPDPRCQLNDELDPLLV